MRNRYVVNGLPLPTLLIELLQQGKWKHPGEDIIQDVIPFLHAPMQFMVDSDWMNSETRCFDDDLDDELFHQTRGSKSSAPIELPWLDCERMVFIAICKYPGDDVAIALDYRTNSDDPRVVASDLQDNEYYWREVTPTFTEFVERLGLT